jgi:hypothetical protein
MLKRLHTGQVNPYKIAIRLILKRIKWMIHYSAWQSKRKLKRLKDTHVGETAVILCNGPSLLKVDFDALQRSGVYCFGLNKINLLFARTSFRPSCIVAVNPFVIQQNADFYNNTDIPIFIDKCGLGGVKIRENVAFLDSTDFPSFARDCSISIFQGYTVTYVAMQLAYHMGFTRVALVGADHNFAVKGPSNMTVVSGEKDESHFDPNYFAGGVKWQLPDLFNSEVYYTMAREEFKSNGRIIVNATDGGQLEVFGRVTLQEFLCRH